MEDSELFFKVSRYKNEGKLAEAKTLFDSYIKKKGINFSKFREFEYDSEDYIELIHMIFKQDISENNPLYKNMKERICQLLDHMMKLNGVSIKVPI